MTTKLAATLVQIAKEMQPWIRSTRRHLHLIPEVRWQEEETLEFILQCINEVGTSSQCLQKPIVDVNKAKGGIWADVTFDKDLNRILLRSDIDALPIQEQTGLAFSSQNAGVMHACGHDAHAAMLLGAFKALMENDIPVIHNLRFVFQRAEENPLTRSGGATLVREGVLEGIKEAYALHIWSTSKPGLFLSRPGPMMANSDRLKIIVRCAGGHVAAPHQGSNAIDIAVDIQTAVMAEYSIRRMPAGKKETGPKTVFGPVHIPPRNATPVAPVPAIFIPACLSVRRDESFSPDHKGCVAGSRWRTNRTDGFFHPTRDSVTQ